LTEPMFMVSIVTHSHCDKEQITTLLHSFIWSSTHHGYTIQQNEQLLFSKEKSVNLMHLNAMNLSMRLNMFHQPQFSRRIK